MTDVAINEDIFLRRLKLLYSSWKVGTQLQSWHTVQAAHSVWPHTSHIQEGDNWSGATAIAVAVGASKEELRYHKSITLQLWLFAYEIPGERLPPKCVLSRLFPGPAAPHSTRCAWLRPSKLTASLMQWLGTGNSRAAFCPDHGFESPLDICLVALDLIFPYCSAADTIIVFTKDRVHFLTSTKKGEASQGQLACLMPSCPALRAGDLPYTAPGSATSLASTRCLH